VAECIRVSRASDPEHPVTFRRGDIATPSRQCPAARGGGLDFCVMGVRNGGWSLFSPGVFVFRPLLSEISKQSRLFPSVWLRDW
jgi:hypothetical protein